MPRAALPFTAAICRRLPIPSTKKAAGPAWSNSLFEDNAEFGLGFRLTIDQHTQVARELVQEAGSGDRRRARYGAAECRPDGRSRNLRSERKSKSSQGTPEGNAHRKTRRSLLSLADYLVKKSVWIVGGDGWAYDIGYGGLDHVLASGRNVNVLVLDSEVYSNTGGQMSKSTPRAAVAKFAAGGKPDVQKGSGTACHQLRKRVCRDRGAGRE